MLAAGLTEALNVFPVLAKRMGIDGKIIILIMAIVLGKLPGQFSNGSILFIINVSLRKGHLKE